MPKDLITTFREFVAREQLFAHNDKLLLACSGGMDSTVLAHLLHQEGYDFAIAHMNFQLRGAASDGDAAFVEELARTLGAKFYGKAVDVKAEAQPGESTQMTCRRLRYQWFNQISFENKFSWVLTAHHQDDNLETSLINMIRGTGVAGLRGMLPKAEGIVRPFLDSSRVSVKMFATSKNIKWREDKSNASDKYLRNRIRHKLLPILSDDFGLTPQKWSKTTANLQRDYLLRRAGLMSLRGKYVQQKNYRNSTVIKRTDWHYFDKPLFEDLVFDLGKEFFFTNDEIRQILSFRGQRTLKSSKFQAYVTPKTISFVQLTEPDEKLPNITIDEIMVSRNPSEGYIKARYKIIPKPGNLNQPGCLYLTPPSGVGGLPLHLRPRKDGDRFQPLGLGGKTKKVKDYMIDAKIPVWLRDRIYLLTNDQDEIMAIPGYCISEKFKVRPEDEMVLAIRTI